MNHARPLPALAVVAWLGAYSWASPARCADGGTPPPTETPVAASTAPVAPAVSPTDTPAAAAPSGTPAAPAVPESVTPTAVPSTTPADARFVAPPPGAQETWSAPEFEKGSGPTEQKGKATKTPISEEERERQYKPGGVLLSTGLSGAMHGDAGPTVDMVFLWYIGRMLYFEKELPGAVPRSRHLKYLDPLGAILLGPDLKYSLSGSDPEQPTLAVGALAPFILQINPSTRSIAAPVENTYKRKGTWPIPLLAAYAATTQHLGGLDVTFGACGGTVTRLVSYLTTNVLAGSVDPYQGHSLGFAYVSDPVSFGVFGGFNTRRKASLTNFKLEVFAPVPHPQSPILVHFRVTRFLPFDFALLAYNWKKGYGPDWALLGMYDYRVTFFPAPEPPAAPAAPPSAPAAAETPPAKTAPLGGK